MLLEGNKTRPAETFSSTSPERLLATCLLLPPQNTEEGSENNVGADIIHPPYTF